MELILVQTVRGGRALERHLHAVLGDHLIRGEWFQPSRDLLAKIRREIQSADPSFLDGLDLEHPTLATAKARREAREYFEGIKSSREAKAIERFRSNLSQLRAGAERMKSAL